MSFRTPQKPEAEHTAASVRLAAMNLLARREHSAQELRRKLKSKGHPPELIDPAIIRLQKEHLLDDGRFTEAYIRYRRERGYGPVRIRQELGEKGVQEDLIAEYLDERDSDWREHVLAVREKKFTQQLPDDFKERARQARFLQYRGFTQAQIQSALQGNEWD